MALDQQTGGFTWEELRDSVWKYPEFEYRKYEKGLLRADGQPGFSTETGRAEVYSMVFHHTSWSGLDPLPSYVEPFESPYSAPEDVEEYPYIVTSGARMTKLGPLHIDEAEKVFQYDFLPQFTLWCDLCAERTSKGKVPSCVQHCQSQCLECGPIDELAAKMANPKDLLYAVKEA